MIIVLQKPSLGRICFKSAGRISYIFRDRNREVQAGSPDKIFDKKCLYV
jgi:hypothetical protein